MNPTLTTMLDHGIIVVLRGIDEARLPYVADALIKGGVRLAEVTFVQGGDPLATVRAIDFLTREYADALCVGAGTVLSLAELNMAADAGAKYIIAPNTDAALIKRTKKLGLVSMPGAFTPTEVVAAHAAGADIVKIFPSDIGGAKYIKSLKAPLPHVRMAAVGGVTTETLPQFFAAGAEAFGISTGIVKPDCVRCGEYADATRRAREYTSLFYELHEKR